jgi:hypothetical protein
LTIKHQNNASLRLQYLPIAPSPPHPDNQHLLHIEGERLHKPSYICIRQAMTFSTKAFRQFGNRKLADTSYSTLLLYTSSIEVLNFVPVTRTTPSTPALPRPYSEPYSLWNNYRSSDDVDTGHVPTVWPSPPALPSAFSRTQARTQAQRIGVVPYSNPNRTPALRTNPIERFYGTFVHQSSEQSWQSQTAAHDRNPDPNKKPSIFGAVLTLCIFAGVIVAVVYFGYVGIIALSRWIWSEIQGTWIEKALAWTGQTISWSANAVLELVKITVNYIRHLFGRIGS